MNYEKCRVVLSPDAEEVYKYLNRQAPNSKIEKSILGAINKKVDLIKFNVHYGDSIKKDHIPIKYRVKYGITNLFRVELPNFWRMYYTLTDDENRVEIIAFVLDIMDHKEYDKVRKEL